ncbi:CHAT domain-containing protein [Aquimarina aquimarini]|uniref:CHAT domain-containing protein n=1 Tax=Aquimarina aquimarini TaxID=1191734 RepID=UPI0021038CD2|nr:CHAT domain-containing tetratricopeptide repeat protein [Aquimarina aquimarini]
MARSYHNMAIIYYYTLDYKNALQNYRKALAINIDILGKDHPKVGNTYNNMGIIYNDQGKFNLAIEYYKKAIQIKIKNSENQHVDIGSFYLNIGIVYSNLKDERALDYYKKALKIYSKENYLKGLSAIYQNFGVFYSDVKGEYDKALEYYKKGLDVAIRYYDGDNYEVIGDIYHNIATMFSIKKDYKKTLYYFNNALQNYKTTLGENHENIAMVYESMGNMYVIKKEEDKALLYYEKCLKIRNIIFDMDHPSIVAIYNNIGELYQNKKNYKKALEYYQKGLELTQNRYGKEHLLTGACYTHIATIYQEQQEYQKAISYFDKALIANTKNKNSNTIDLVFDSSEYYDSKLLLETLSGKAKTLQLQFKQNNNIKDIQHSIVLYEYVDQVINSIRQSYQNYKDKVAIGNKAKEVYTDAINTLLLEYENKQEQISLDKVFYYIEKSKSNVLKELLNDSYAKNVIDIELPIEHVSLEKEVKTNQAFYRSQIIEEKSNSLSDTLKIREYENKLFSLNRRQDSLTKIIEENYPNYYQLRRKNEIISITEIQEQIDRNTTVLEYFSTDSVTYAFSISKYDVSVKKLNTPYLKNNIKEFQESITTQYIKSYKKIANILYTQLILPIKNDLVGNRLIIIPDGPLWHLNFELLHTKEIESDKALDFPYVLREYAISYANSTNVLFNSFKRNDAITSTIKKECLAFSFSDTLDVSTGKMMSLSALRDAGDDLPGTRKEIKAISEIIDGQYYYGIDAIETNFKENAGQYSILHLALHGEVDHNKPENSKLYFTKSNDTLEDNLLYSHELFALDIPADLTVLSACNTGTGQVANGEGIMSLGTAFQYAGTKSLLLSSWEVSDRVAPELMKYFYSNLEKGMSKDQALQQAKLKYINTADIFYTNPFYWGSFYLLGNSDPIVIDTPFVMNRLYWILLISVILCLLLVVFYYIKKNRV